MADHFRCSESDIFEFLRQVQAKLMLNEMTNLVIIQRLDHKNQNCMAELNLRHKDVAKIIKSLEVKDYSHSVNDNDDRFKGAILRVFGHVLHGNQTLYIKLALRSKVICVSIHTEEYELTYPYK